MSDMEERQAVPEGEEAGKAKVPRKRVVRKTAKTAKAAAPPEALDGGTGAGEAGAAPGEGAAGKVRRYGRVAGGGPVGERGGARPVSEEPVVPVSAEGGPGPAAVERVAAAASPGGFVREGRNKRRRDKRKRRHPGGPGEGSRGEDGEEFAPEGERRSSAPDGPRSDCDGMLEMAPKGYGFLRVASKNFEQARDDVFVAPEFIRRYGLRPGQWIRGMSQEGSRGPQLVEISAVNDLPPEEAAKLPHFEELKAVNPSKRISFETTPDRFTTRVVDIMAPVGRGQRGLIVSPPRSGKTTLLLHMAEAVREKYEEAIHLMVVLVDERPEEVTEFRRALPGVEIYASSNDEHPRSHCRIAEMAIERAKRLVEAGRDVFVLMDSITRLARAYNNTMGNRGRATGSGGITIGALEVPRRLFAAARNTRGGGSLTILATALIQTNSRADEAIFMEFKGTGNMELVLDRKIAENYMYPAVDIFKSGTRREELLLPGHMLHKIHLIRRGLSGHRPVEAMERLLFFLKKFPNNPQMLLEIKG